MSGKNLRSDEVHLEGELGSTVEGPGFDAVKAVTPELFVGSVAGSNSGPISLSDSGLSPGFQISVPVESHVVRLRVYRPSIFSAPEPAADLSGLWMLVCGDARTTHEGSTTMNTRARAAPRTIEAICPVCTLVFAFNGARTASAEGCSWMP